MKGRKTGNYASLNSYPLDDEDLEITGQEEEDGAAPPPHQLLASRDKKKGGPTLSSSSRRRGSLTKRLAGVSSKGKKVSSAEGRSSKVFSRGRSSSNSNSNSNNNNAGGTTRPKRHKSVPKSLSNSSLTVSASEKEEDFSPTISPNVTENSPSSRRKRSPSTGRSFSVPRTRPSPPTEGGEDERKGGPVDVDALDDEEAQRSEDESIHEDMKEQVNKPHQQHNTLAVNDQKENQLDDTNEEKEKQRETPKEEREDRPATHRKTKLEKIAELQNECRKLKRANRDLNHALQRRESSLERTLQDVAAKDSKHQQASPSVRNPQHPDNENASHASSSGKFSTPSTDPSSKHAEAIRALTDAVYRNRAYLEKERARSDRARKDLDEAHEMMERLEQRAETAELDALRREKETHTLRAEVSALQRALDAALRRADQGEEELKQHRVTVVDLHQTIQDLSGRSGVMQDEALAKNLQIERFEDELLARDDKLEEIREELEKQIEKVTLMEVELEEAQLRPKQERDDQPSVSSMATTLEITALKHELDTTKNHLAVARQEILDRGKQLTNLEERHQEEIEKSRQSMSDVQSSMELMLEDAKLATELAKSDAEQERSRADDLEHENRTLKTNIQQQKETAAVASSSLMNALASSTIDESREEELEEAKSEAESAKRDAEVAKAQLQSAEQRLHILEEEKDAFEHRLMSISDNLEMDKVRLQEELTAAKSHTAAINAELAQSKTRIQDLQNETILLKDTSAKTVADLEEELSRSKLASEQAQADIELAKAKAEEMHERFEKLEKENCELRQNSATEVPPSQEDAGTSSLTLEEGNNAAASNGTVETLSEDTDTDLTAALEESRNLTKIAKQEANTARAAAEKAKSRIAELEAEIQKLKSAPVSLDAPKQSSERTSPTSDAVVTPQLPNASTGEGTSERTARVNRTMLSQNLNPTPSSQAELIAASMRGIQPPISTEGGIGAQNQQPGRPSWISNWTRGVSSHGNPAVPAAAAAAASGVANGDVDKRTTELRDRDTRIDYLERTNKANEETIQKLRSEFVRLNCHYKEEAYLQRMKIEKLQQENTAYKIKVSVLEKEFMSMNGDNRGIQNDDNGEDTSATDENDTPVSDGATPSSKPTDAKDSEGTRKRLSEMASRIAILEQEKIDNTAMIKALRIGLDRLKGDKTYNTPPPNSSLPDSDDAMLSELKERDDIIAKLQETCRSHERTVESLRSALATLRAASAREEQYQLDIEKLEDENEVYKIKVEVLERQFKEMNGLQHKKRDEFDGGGSSPPSSSSSSVNPANSDSPSIVSLDTSYVAGLKADIAAGNVRVRNMEVKLARTVKRAEEKELSLREEISTLSSEKERLEAMVDRHVRDSDNEGSSSIIEAELRTKLECREVTIQSLERSLKELREGRLSKQGGRRSARRKSIAPPSGLRDSAKLTEEEERQLKETTETLSLSTSSATSTSNGEST